MTDDLSKEIPSIMPKQYPCPRCGKMTAWQTNPYKPFCSDRCKLIDLGAWASEEYKLASSETPFSGEME